MKTRKLLYILPLAALVACEPEFDDVDFNGGSADFTRTVAVGNSLVAGYQSNALSQEGQVNSIPNIIAQQLKEVGGGAFSQPLLTGEAGEKGVSLEPSILPGLVLPELFLGPSMNCIGETSLAPSVGTPYSSASFFNPIGQNGPFNNVGVPGAKLTNLNQPGYGSIQGNPYFARFAANPLETMVGAAMKVDATFFELWIGNNDVLGYATGGGEEANNPITPQQTFANEYNKVLDSLVKNGARGVVANIPNITSIPYFTTVPTGTNALSEAQANALNAAYAPYNGGLALAAMANPAFQPEADLRKISFEAGDFNRFVVLDPSLSPIPNLPSIRQIKSGEFLTLVTPSDSLLCAQWGTATPIPGEFHLNANEVGKIATAIEGYNMAIKQEARNRGLAYVDANQLLNRLSTTGITENGVNFSSTLVTGGAFSLDGVHPNTRGYAILANEFIDAINSTYSANIPKVDVTSYPALEVGQ